MKSILSIIHGEFLMSAYLHKVLKFSHIMYLIYYSVKQKIFFFTLKKNKCLAIRLNQCASCKLFLNLFYVKSTYIHTCFTRYTGNDIFIFGNFFQLFNMDNSVQQDKLANRNECQSLYRLPFPLSKPLKHICKCFMY